MINANQMDTNQQGPQQTPPPFNPPAGGPPPAGQQKNTLMAILAYVGPLVIVSYLMAKDDPFVKFHIKQGLVVFIAEVIIWVLGASFWHLWAIINLLNLATLILSIIGIINASKGEEKELPGIGHLGRNIHI